MGAPPDYRAIFAMVPEISLLLGLDLTIQDANDAYLTLRGEQLAEISGRPVFDVVNLDEAGGDRETVGTLRRALSEVTLTRLPVHLPMHRIDTGDPATGRPARYWSVNLSPIVGIDGTVERLLVQATDVTHQTQSTRRLTALAEVALLISGARDVSQLADIVIGAGLVAIGADGGALGVIEGEALKLTLTESLGPENRLHYPELVLADSLVTIAHTARSGEAVLLPTLEETQAWSTSMAKVYEETHKRAWATLPLWADGRLIGALAVSWASDHSFPDDEIELLRAFAAQTAQALDRLQIRAEEQALEAASRRLSETLQRSLLTEPPRIDTLAIAARYQPAARDAQIGGDWYDAFLTPSGDTTLVIGDVSGHDRNAAAAMGQIRNVLRGVAQCIDAAPSTVLTALDQAMHNLEITVLATALVAQIHQTPEQALTGRRTLQWSSAGHPPPLMLRPDGATEVLGGEPDLLLGIDGSAPRCDFETEIYSGCTILLYTDGLVERRGEPLDTGIERLREVASRFSQLSVEELADALIGQMDGGIEDDLALVAVRALPT